MVEEFDWDFDPQWITDPEECLRMFFIFDTVLENSMMDAMDALELFILIQQESIQ